MLYCIDPTADEPIMLINTHIGYDSDEGQGVDGAIFQQELLMLDSMGKKRIQVWINSPGGIVMDGYNIYTAILKSKTKVDTYNVGIAASIAAVIFQAGRNRYMADYAKLMYHNPYGGDSKELGVMKDSIAIMIAERTSKPKEDVLKIMDRTTWISASEALAGNFCDSIEVTARQNQKRMVATEPKAMWKEGAEILNSLLTKTDKTMFNKVANKLGLVSEASEDSILDAITKIENRAVSAESKLTETQNKLTEVQNEAEQAKAELKEANEKLEKAETEKKEAEETALTEKAKNMVEGYAKAGRIKNEAEVITKWVNLAKVDFAGTEQLIKDLPVTKVANKIELTNVANEANLTNVVAAKMAELRNK